VLAGRYRVERVLGQGGMGLVVQAMHLQLHQPVAMKFLLPEVLGTSRSSSGSCARRRPRCGCAASTWRA
jgi:serine/threonine-protein kinase